MKLLYVGRGRFRKVVGVLNYGVKVVSDVGKKKMVLMMRSFVGRLVVGEVWEVVMDLIFVEELVFEGMLLKMILG